MFLKPQAITANKAGCVNWSAAIQPSQQVGSGAAQRQDVALSAHQPTLLEKVALDDSAEAWLKVSAREAAKAEPNCQVPSGPGNDNDLI